MGLAGKPRHGPVCEHKVRSNARFKYAVRFIKKNEQTMRANTMARKLQLIMFMTFWKEVKWLTTVNACGLIVLMALLNPENIVEYGGDTMRTF